MSSWGRWLLAWFSSRVRCFWADLRARGGKPASLATAIP